MPPRRQLLCLGNSSAGPNVLTLVTLRGCTGYLTFFDMEYLLPYHGATGTQSPQKLSRTHKNAIYNQVICHIPTNLLFPSESLKCPNK